MKKIAIALGIVTIAVPAVVLAYIVLVRGIPLNMIPLLWQSQPKEHSAAYYPDDTVAYFWMTLNPSDGQRADMLSIWEQFNELEGFEDARMELEERLHDLAGIEVKEDVLPWIGTEISAGIFSADFGDYGELEGIEFVATVDVRDLDAAEIFMRKLRNFVEEETATRFDSDMLGRFEVWIAEDDKQAYALSKELLIVASSEKTLLDIIGRIGNDDSSNLAATESFIEARTALPERRFSSVYVDMHAAEELATDFYGGFYPAMPSEDSACPAFGSIPNWAAASAAWQSDAIHWEIVTPSADDIFTGTRSVADAAALLPDDTLGFVAFSFESDMDKWREALDECLLIDTIPLFDEPAIEDFNESLYFMGLDNVDFDDMPELTVDSTLADLLDLGIWLVDEQTGIHFEEDFTDYLSGDMVISVRDFKNFNAVTEGDTVEAVLSLSYREEDEESLSDTMEDIFELFGNYGGLNTTQQDVGASSPAELLDLRDILGGTDFEYAPGYVLHDGYLSLGSDVMALEAVVSRQNGEMESLKATALYDRTSRYFFDGNQGIVYVDVRRIVNKFEPSDLEIGRDEYELLEESIGAVGVSSHTADDYNRARAVVTLFPMDK